MLYLLLLQILGDFTSALRYVHIWYIPVCERISRLWVNTKCISV